MHTGDRYTSPGFFHYLQSQHLNAVGMVRVNRRYMPEDLQVRARGDVDSRSTGTGMLCLQWHDQRPVTMLSTVHDSDMVTVSGRSLKPKVVADFIGMKRVALSKLAKADLTSDESVNLTAQILYKLVDMAVENAYLVHRTLGGTLARRAFRKEIVRELLRDFHRWKDTVRDPGPEEDRFQGGHHVHFLVPVPSGRYRRCKVCHARGARKETRSMCEHCHVALCPYECFQVYHTVKNYA